MSTTRVIKLQQLSKKFEQSLKERGYNLEPEAIARLTGIAYGHFYLEHREQGKATQVLAERWYSDLKSRNENTFKGGRKRHSYYQFAKYIDKRYFVVYVQRNKFTEMIRDIASYLYEMYLKHGSDPKENYVRRQYIAKGIIKK